MISQQRELPAQMRKFSKIQSFHSKTLWFQRLRGNHPHERKRHRIHGPVRTRRLLPKSWTTSGWTSSLGFLFTFNAFHCSLDARSTSSSAHTFESPNSSPSRWSQTVSSPPGALLSLKWVWGSAKSCGTAIEWVANLLTKIWLGYFTYRRTLHRLLLKDGFET